MDTAEPSATAFLENLPRPPPAGLPTRPLTFTPSSSGPLQRLMAANYVFIRRGAPGPPLSPLYDSPCRVAAKSPKVFKLQLGNRIELVTVDRLKPCLSSKVVPVAPPQRGSPPLPSTEPQPSASILGGPCGGRQIRQTATEIIRQLLCASLCLTLLLSTARNTYYYKLSHSDYSVRVFKVSC